METELLRVDSKNPNSEDMKRAGALIAAGELVAFPTETVYGLGGDALAPDAAKKIYAAKGRPSDNPLIVHIADFAGLERVAREIPREARLLADAFWPGPLTMIVWKNDSAVCHHRRNGHGGGSYAQSSGGPLPDPGERMPDCCPQCKRIGTAKPDGGSACRGGFKRQDTDDP